MPPLACIVRSCLHLNRSTALRGISWGILFHAFLREPFNASAESWSEAHASASKIDDTQQFIELVWWRGRPNFLTLEMRKTVLAPFLSFVARVWWSCWSVNGLCLKCFLASARARGKMVSMYELVLISAPCGTKMRRDFYVLETAVHTMTEDGFWPLKTFRMKSGMSTEDLASIRLFCWLNTFSTLNTFSSEKMSSPVSVPDFILFRRIFTRVTLFSF